ncbi:hypothetical protein O6H91_03G107400 [Diphasiastrum complanatum]|uniref:Uncharacterized protein n=1 Tax=Diphasiastrum complanatum TaxID=34168 RepID=A0ACC2EAQ5_DIPCM|nr:hypothetical protein O6H91_03G107400 [Diphasiastrum complanatum]
MEVSPSQISPLTPQESGVNLSLNPPARASNSTCQDSSLLVLASDLVVDADSFGFSGNAKCLDNNDSAASMADNDDFKDLEELQVLRVEGCDREGRRIVRIVGKFYPATVVDSGRLKRYAHSKLLNELKEESFVIVYFHTLVQRNENSPGMLALRQIYEALPGEKKQKLQTIYFVHPGLRSRLLLATLGRYFLSEGDLLKDRFSGLF